ncbi:hypothetical protein [Salinimicrobium flavum]|uniref:Uncharacterized protein n=1 Tax=Salinimicrobium flavum TaxID=1737065 RepID=A0ABW5IUG7_9FLAO
MRKYLFLLMFSFALSTSLVSCRETKNAADATGEAIEEGVNEAGENTGLGGEDDL